MQTSLQTRSLQNTNLSKQQVAFTARAEQAPAQEHHPPSAFKKAAMLALGVIVLAIPVALTKVPVGKVAALRNLQEGLKRFLKETVKPYFDKLMSHNKGASPLGGLR